MTKHEMTCKDLLGSLSDYVDGDLNEEVCHEIERHMQGCERCRVVVDTINRTIYLYKTDGADTGLPSNVRERLFDTLNLDDIVSPKPS